MYQIDRSSEGIRFGVRDRRGAVKATAVSPTHRLSLFTLALAIGSCVLPLALYWRTLSPAEVGGDGGEFQVVATVLGISHYTGYPLYTLVGHLWTLMDQIGTPAVRVNMLSAIFGAGACLAVYWGVMAAGGRPVAALVAALSLAIFPLEWNWSVMAGVRSLAALFTALVLALAIRWAVAVREERATGQAAGALSTTWWLLLCLSCGLALAHHRSIALLGPPLAIYLLSIQPGLITRLRHLLAGILLVLLPLLTYLYLPIRSAMGAPYDQMHPDTLHGFVELVFAGNLSSSMLTSLPLTALPSRALVLLTDIAHQLGILSVLVVVGIACGLAVRRGAPLVGRGFTALLFAQIIDWNSSVGVNDVYLIPVLVLAAFSIGAALSTLAELASQFPGVRQRACVGAVYVVGVALFLAQARTVLVDQRLKAHQAMSDFRQDLTSGWRAHRLAAESIPYLPRDAIIAADWQQATVFWYEKLVAHTLPTQVIDFGLGDAEALTPQALRATYGDHPIFATRPVDWAKGLHPSAAGPLISVSSTARTAPWAEMTPTSVNLEGGLGLVAYQLFNTQGTPVASPTFGDDVVGVLLAWRADQVQAQDISFSLRLVDAQGNVRAQHDNRPVYGLAPTTSWQQGEVVADYAELPLAGLGPGSYSILALPYYQPTPGTYHNLHSLAAGGTLGPEGVIVATIHL